MIEVRINAKKVDVLLVAEGTYPFVKGGVAQWIYDIINNLPNLSFGIIFLGAYEGLYEDYAYPLPANIHYLQITYLFTNENTDSDPIVLKAKKNKAALNKVINMHDVFRSSHGCPQGLVSSIDDLSSMLLPSTGFSHSQFLHSKDAWEFISQQYLAHSTDPSFIDYFWNIRNMHAPLWQLEKALDKAPLTRVIHTISTGYAGLLACMLHQRYQYPLLLSEHGIYTKERNIELMQSAMLINIDKLITSKKEFSYQHQLWIKFFDSLARICYHYACIITSLFTMAQSQQVLAGANLVKALITPNGVDIEKFDKLRRTRGPVPKIVGFVGRFVRIKDLKTFIRAVDVMTSLDKDIEAWIRIVGQGDNEYIQECKDYINLMELNTKIKFITEGNMETILAQVGVLVLTSISEGMPLVVLESLAAGIPVVSTDVGACREIIEGKDDEDRLLGECGKVVTIGDAVAVAHAVVKILNDEAYWYEKQRIGIQRIERYYTQTTMIATYQNIYDKVMTDGGNRI